MVLFESLPLLPVMDPYSLTLANVRALTRPSDQGSWCPSSLKARGIHATLCIERFDDEMDVRMASQL